MSKNADDQPTPPRQQPPVALFGEVLFDCFPDGRRVLGGAPFNAAWHLQAFGAAPLLISAVGDDADGEHVRAAMKAWGMETRAVQRDPLHATGIVQVMIEDDEPHYDIVADRAFDHIQSPDPVPSPRLLYHGTLALRRSVSAGTLQGLQTAGPGLRLLDVNLRDPWWSRDDTLALVAGADWVKLNHDELLQLGAMQSDAPDTDAAGNADVARQAGAFRRHYGLAGLVVTLGAAGVCAVIDDGRMLQLPASPVPDLKDTVGAGDGFAAVLMLGLLRDWPIETTLERALAFAARICGQQGATAADPALYRPFIDDWGLAPGPG